MSALHVPDRAQHPKLKFLHVLDRAHHLGIKTSCSNVIVSAPSSNGSFTQMPRPPLQCSIRTIGRC